MTVAELIEVLKKEAPDLLVRIDTGTKFADFVDVETVSRVSMYDDDNCFVVLNWTEANAT